MATAPPLTAPPDVDTELPTEDPLPIHLAPDAAGTSEAAEDELSAGPRAATYLSPDRAARCLSDAWLQHTGERPQSHVLAVLCAHWAMETGRGRRMMGNNFAGIKGRSSSGMGIQLWTREHDGFQRRRVKRTFRAYPSPSDGAADYIDLLATRYPRALRAAARASIVDFVAALETGGYFTDDPETYRRAMFGLHAEFSEMGVIADTCGRDNDQ